MVVLDKEGMQKVYSQMIILMQSKIVFFACYSSHKLIHTRKADYDHTKNLPLNSLSTSFPHTRPSTE